MSRRKDRKNSVTLQETNIDRSSTVTAPVDAEITDAGTTESPRGDLPQAYVRSEKRHHLVLLALAGLVLLLSAVLNVRDERYVLIPGTTIPLPELCTMKRVSGWGCPGCGLTRCFVSLAHGDLTAALSYNPVGILVFAFVVAQVPYRLVQLHRLSRGKEPYHSFRFVGWAMGTIGVLMFLQWGIQIVLGGLPQ